MKNPKFSNIPMDIIDTRFQEIAKAEPPFATNKRLPDLELKTLLLMVIQQLVIGLRKPMLALKFHLLNLAKRFPQIKKLPWLKLCVLALAAYVLFGKDMQVNFAMKAPIPIFSDEDDDRELSNVHTAVAQSVAQTVSLKTGAENPYAPAEPMSLRDIQVRDFVRSYGPLAIEEMHLSGVPASITIAQGLIESRCGESKLAKQNNNFFGIKCFSKKCPKGHCTNATDDHHKDFFRKYPHANKSFRHHSQILTQGRYKHLSKKGKDYVAWAKGLKKAGYATDKNYDKKLIKIIEEYQLYNLDKR